MVLSLGPPLRRVPAGPRAEDYDPWFDAQQAQERPLCPVDKDREQLQPLPDKKKVVKGRFRAWHPKIQLCVGRKVWVWSPCAGSGPTGDGTYPYEAVIAEVDTEKQSCTVDFECGVIQSRQLWDNIELANPMHYESMVPA
jgi:hypothetical protein